MMDLWTRLGEVASRNRPRRKPQLWEDFPLAVRRRAAFEIGRRLDPEWVNRGHLIELSNVGFHDGMSPMRMEVVPREMINRALFLYGSFEISETRLIQSFLRPGMTFVDLGANIGYYTLIGARLVGTSGVVHAFEPNRPMRARLTENVRRNGFENVAIHAEAVARQTGVVHFYPSTFESNQGISSIIPGDGRTEAEVVPCVNLDDFVAGLGARRPDLVKMDIEGAELQVIEGGGHALGGQDAPSIIFEAFDLPPIASALRSLGYEIRRLHYTLEHGLELPDTDANVESLFAAYEAPNYFAAKSDAVFTDVVARARAGRSAALSLFGRL